MCGVLILVLLGFARYLAPDACARKRLLATGKGPIGGLQLIPFGNPHMWIDLEEYDDIPEDSVNAPGATDCKNLLKTHFAYTANAICLHYGCDVTLIGYIPIRQGSQSRFLNGLVSKDKLAWTRFAKSIKRFTFHPKSEALLLAQEAKFYARCDAYLEYVKCTLEKVLSKPSVNGNVRHKIKANSVLYNYTNHNYMKEFIEANGGALDFFTVHVMQYMCKFVYSTCPPLFTRLQHIHSRMTHWCSVVDFYTPITQRENLYTYVGNDAKVLLEHEAKLTAIFDVVESDLLSSQLGFPLVGKNSKRELKKYRKKVCKLRCSSIVGLWALTQSGARLRTAALYRVAGFCLYIVLHCPSCPICENILEK